MLSSSAPGRTSVFAALVCLGLGLALGGCSMAGGGGSATPLSPGLSARMDQPGAILERGQAIGMLNHYRTGNGAGPLIDDAALNETARRLVTEYARTGSAPKLPSGVTVIRVSAGYPTFAETFSGWRNSRADAAGLADPSVRRAGLATTYSAGSGYGVYWVLVLAP